MLRRLVLAILAAATIAPVALAEPVYEEAGVALGGIDPVSYHTQGQPELGDPGQALMWRGSEWRFVDAGNRRLFEGDPKRYMPAFGGYCAVGVAQGELVPGDPQVWAIHHGRLFLLEDQAMRARFTARPDPIVERAAARWPDLEE